MNTTELMLKIKDLLEAEGFETKSMNGEGYENAGRAWRNGSAVYKEYTKYGITCKGYFGDDIEFGVVYRRNITEEDISVDIAILHWEESSGRRITRQRVNTKMSEKQIQNRFNKIMNEWNKIEA